MNIPSHHEDESKQGESKLHRIAQAVLGLRSRLQSPHGRVPLLHIQRPCVSSAPFLVSLNRPEDCLRKCETEEDIIRRANASSNDDNNSGKRTSSWRSTLKAHPDDKSCSPSSVCIKQLDATFSDCLCSLGYIGILISRQTVTVPYT